ncbi:MAG TPA: hypothetical protein VJ836_04450 [Candidatus Saccharimonadales bacterium]|nr:hypothetical protein [Candidatus Saccharimonadales bacterium]
MRKGIIVTSTFSQAEARAATVKGDLEELGYNAYHRHFSDEGKGFGRDRYKADVHWYMVELKHTLGEAGVAGLIVVNARPGDDLEPQGLGYSTYHHAIGLEMAQVAIAFSLGVHRMLYDARPDTSQPRRWEVLETEYAMMKSLGAVDLQGQISNVPLVVGHNQGV